MTTLWMPSKIDALLIIFIENGTLKKVDILRKTGKVFKIADIVTSISIDIHEDKIITKLNKMTFAINNSQLVVRKSTPNK